MSRDLNISACSILLFIRDPIESVISEYTQLVKGQGRAEPIEAHLANFNVPDLVLRFIEALEPLPEVDLTVRNYSQRRHALDQVVADWLGVPGEDLAAPPVSTVNRSLTRSETALLRELNKYLERSAGPIGKRLVTKAPNVTSDPVTLPEKAQHDLATRLRPTIDAVNAKLADPTDSYSIEPTPPDAEPDWLTFDSAQIEALAAEFAETINRERQKTLLSAARTVWAEAPEAALQLFDQAVQVRPNDEGGHAALLDALTQLERWQDMEGALVRAVAEVPDPLAYRHRLAKWYLRTDRPDSATDVLRGAVDDGAANAQTFWLLARGHLRLSELEAALAAIDSALDMGVSPLDRALADKGRILESRGETDAALGAYEQALRLDADNQAARAGQSRLRVAGDART